MTYATTIKSTVPFMLTHTWFVPQPFTQFDLRRTETTHQANLRKPPAEMSNAQAERYYLDQYEVSHLRFKSIWPGDFMIYRNLGWHTGNYITYQHGYHS